MPSAAEPRRRVQDAEANAVPFPRVACDAGAARAERATSGPFSTSTPRKGRDDRRSAARVIVVGMAHDEAVEAAAAAGGERGQDDLLAAVEPRARRRAGIEQQPVRARLDEHGEPVTDVEHDGARGAVRRQLDARATQTGSSASHAKRRPGKPAPQTANATPSAAAASAGTGGSGNAYAAPRSSATACSARTVMPASERDRVHERRRPRRDARRATARASRARRAARGTR